MSSGYTNCRCRDCFDIAVSNDMNHPDFCSDCKKASCGDDQECQRPDAYGVGELISDAAEAQEMFGDDELEAHRRT